MKKHIIAIVATIAISSTAAMADDPRDPPTFDGAAATLLTQLSPRENMCLLRDACTKKMIRFYRLYIVANSAAQLSSGTPSKRAAHRKLLIDAYNDTSDAELKAAYLQIIGHLANEDLAAKQDLASLVKEMRNSR